MSTSPPPDPNRLKGTVRRVVYVSPQRDFAVLRLAVEAARGEPQSSAEITVLGPVADVSVGEPLAVEGGWEEHAVHGKQFRAERAVVEVPRTTDGVSRYLETLHGIGPALATRLTARFGVGALEVLEAEPTKVAGVKGMGKKRATAAAAELKGRRQDREVMVFLQGLGVSAAYAARIRRTYGNDAVHKIRENPYRLARDVSGIGFQVADRIARGMGVAADSPLRTQAGVIHVLGSFVEEGHVFAPRAALVERAGDVLQIGAAEVEAAVDTLALDRSLVRDGEALYLPWLFQAEVDAAERLMALARADAPARVGAQPATPDEALAKLSPAQREAVALAAREKVLVVTGGPGTGKTTLVRALVSDWERARRRVLLCAPTGRAAKRLQEATGRTAQTIHRALEWGRGEAGQDAFRPGRRSPFGRNRMTPLDADLVVVDESSMLDLPLFVALLEAAPPAAHLVLVGDIDQLPSVGAGQVLADVIASGAVRTVRLGEVFRQAEGSGIVANAYRILSGEMPASTERRGDNGQGDFFVVAAEEAARARELVVRLCQERIPGAFGLDPVDDVQVLTPMHRGGAGTEELNRALQLALNPDGVTLQLAGRELRVGDKVMQVRNDYDRDVYNGDLGRVAEARRDGDEVLVEVAFDGRHVRYRNDEIDQLELAYAVSVHKSQGSEYPAVVIVLQTQHHVLLRRDLLYTAVTRGKRLVVIVGSERAIARAVAVAGAQRRHSRLAERLRLAASDDRLA